MLGLTPNEVIAKAHRQVQEFAEIIKREREKEMKKIWVVSWYVVDEEYVHSEFFESEDGANAFADSLTKAKDLLQAYNFSVSITPREVK